MATATPIALADHHPSVNTKQAWFLFSMTAGGSVRRLLLVEADNTAKVQLLEFILAPAQSDNHPSDTCELLAVFRTADVVGIRSDFVEECPFDEFYEQIVSEEWKDDTTESLFERAMSDRPEEKVTLVKAPVKKAREKAPKLPAGNFDEQLWAPLVSTMTHLGYAKAEVTKLVRDSEEQLCRMDMAEQVKFALRALAKP